MISDDCRLYGGRWHSQSRSLREKLNTRILYREDFRINADGLLHKHRRFLQSTSLLSKRVSPPTAQNAVRNSDMASQQYVLSTRPNPADHALTSPVYENGEVCISTLHPPEDDTTGYESASERWSPVQTPATILLSVISMLSSPNDESAANIEAAKQWREDPAAFKKRVRKCVRDSLEA